MSKISQIYHYIIEGNIEETIMWGWSKAEGQTENDFNAVFECHTQELFFASGSTRPRLYSCAIITRTSRQS